MEEIDEETEYQYASSNFDVENQCIPLVSPLKMELEKFSAPSPEFCVFRISNILREHKEKAYTPQIVSIGPVHYSKEGFKAAKKLKLHYLCKFFNWAKISFEDAVEFVKNRETRIRNCYAPTIDLDDYYGQEFVEMALQDAAFLTAMFISHQFPDLREGPNNDYLFETIGYSRVELCSDLMMLENQLPFFLIVDLFELTKQNFDPDLQRKWDSIYKIIYDFLDIDYIGSSIPEDIDSYDIKHILDFLRYCFLPSIPLSSADLFNLPSATELHKSGVRLKKASNRNTIDLRFTNGFFEIPRIRVDGTTRVLFGNLIAFEKDYYKKDLYINEYIFLIYCLAATSKDVELLVESGIITNELRDNDEASALLNNFGSAVKLEEDNFHYSNLCETLGSHCEVSYHKYMAILRNEYFKNPWKSMAVIAAAFLLLLTLAQTVCSIISVA